MPLQLAADTILRMLRARVHHHRQGQVKIPFIVPSISCKRACLEKFFIVSEAVDDVLSIWHKATWGCHILQ
jgi:hypothetical protein